MIPNFAPTTYMGIVTLRQWSLANESNFCCSFDQVCSYFVYGFPYNLEKYADQSSCEESINNYFYNDGIRGTFPMWWSSGHWARDLLMTTDGPDYHAIKGSIFNRELRSLIGCFINFLLKPLFYNCRIIWNYFASWVTTIILTTLIQRAI